MKKNSRKLIVELYVFFGVDFKNNNEKFPMHHVFFFKKIQFSLDFYENLP